MRNSDLEPYVRSTHIQEEIILFGGKNQNHTHKVQGFGWLVWREGEFYMPAGKTPTLRVQMQEKVSKDNIIYNYNLTHGTLSFACTQANKNQS